MACANYWTSPLQVGSHHIARTFVSKGWEVAFISDPISPLHLLKPSPGLKSRYSIYKEGGLREGKIWSYVPAALMTPHNHSFLKSPWLHHHWHQFTFPSVISKVKKEGFDHPDLLYIDSPFQGFWLDTLSPKRSLYRLADYNKAFIQTAPAKEEAEESLLKKVDFVIYTAKELKEYLTSIGPKRMEFVSNGVDYAHFSKVQPRPKEYKNLNGPIAVYAGAIREWFDAKLVSKAAQSHPHMHFVLIGPNEGVCVDSLPNLHLLGAKSWDTLPAYLQHSDVGIIPFDVTNHPELIHRVNPLKLYEYMASGLPVVSMKWDELNHLGSPAFLASTKDEFIEMVGKATPSSEKAFAEKHDWSHRGDQILSMIP